MFLLFDFIASVCASDFDFTQRDAMMRRSAVDAYRVGLVELCLNRNMQGFMDNIELRKMHYESAALDPKLYPCPSRHKAKYEKNSLEQSFALVESAIEEGYAPAIVFLLSLTSLPTCLDLHRCFVEAGNFQQEKWKIFREALVDSNGRLIQNGDVYLNLLPLIEKIDKGVKQSKLLDFIYRCYCCAHSGKDFGTEQIQRAHMKREIEDHIKCSLYWAQRMKWFNTGLMVLNPVMVFMATVFNIVNLYYSGHKSSTLLTGMTIQNCTGVDLTGCSIEAGNDRVVFGVSLAAALCTFVGGCLNVLFAYQKAEAERESLLENKGKESKLEDMSELLSLYMLFKEGKENPRYSLDALRYIFWYPAPHYRYGYSRVMTTTVKAIALDHLSGKNGDDGLIETLLKKLEPKK